jgi:T-complex protein 1 subunit epsilon
MRAFATALDAVPLALAENSGLSPIDTLADVKSRQLTEQNPRLGIDCMGRNENGALAEQANRKQCSLTELVADMKKQHVYDPLISKRQQFLLATQVVRMILRVDDVIGESLRVALQSGTDLLSFRRLCVWRRVTRAGCSLFSH